MVRPLSYQIRVIYLLAAILFFAVSVPVLIFYAFGYRIGDDWTTIRETGGVHVWTGNSQTDVLIDGVFAERTSFLGRSVFVQNLNPGSYTVATDKAGYRNWSQTVPVYGSRVTEINALLVKDQNRLKLLSVGTTTQDVQVGDEVIAYRPQADVVYIRNLLDAQTKIATSSPKTMLRATSTPVTSSMYSIFRQGSTTVGYMPCVAGEFTGMQMPRPDDIIPQVVADALSAIATTTVRNHEAAKINPLCTTMTLFDGETEPVVWFDFYPRRDDVLLVRTPAELYAVEITNTAPRHVYKLYSGPGQIVTDGRQVYVAVVGSILYEIEL